MPSASTGTAASPTSSISPNSSTGAARRLPPRQSWRCLPRSLQLSHGSPVPRALGGPASVHLSCLALLPSLFSTCKPLLMQKTHLKHPPSPLGRPPVCVGETLALFPQVRASQGSRQASLCSDGSVLEPALSHTGASGHACGCGAFGMWLV